MYRNGTALLTTALLVCMGAGLYAVEAQERQERAVERPQEQTGEHGTWEGRVVDLKSYLMGEDDVTTEPRGVEQPAEQPGELDREQPGEFDQQPGELDREQPEPRGVERPGIGEQKAKGPYALIVEEEGVLGTRLGEATTIYVLLFEEEDPADHIRAIERGQREGLDQQRQQEEGLLDRQREQRGAEQPGQQRGLEQREQRGAEQPGQQRGLEQREQRGLDQPGAAREHDSPEHQAQQMVGQEVRVTGRMLERDGFEAIMVERIERYTATEEVEEQDDDVLDF